MRKLTRRQLWVSLLFPIGILVWAVWGYASRSFFFFGTFVPAYPMQWSYIIAAAVCGAVPIILTLAIGIDTGQYTLPRVLISIATLGLISVIMEFLPNELPYDVVILLIITSLVVSAVYFFKFCPTKFSEWIVIFLSNPVLAAFIYYFALIMPVEDFSFNI